MAPTGEKLIGLVIFVSVIDVPYILAKTDLDVAAIRHNQSLLLVP